MANVQMTGISESMMSQQPGSMFTSAILRRRQDKHVRNFKYLYEDNRGQSDKLRQMREKFRIGDGKSIEKNNISAQQAAGQFNDGSSLMFETG